MKSDKRSGWQRVARVSHRLVRMGLLAILAMGCTTVRAGINVWMSIGPKGGSIQALAIDPQNPSTIYAGTHTDGVFKSTDGGTNWRPVNSGLSALFGRNVHALAIDPRNTSTLYAGGFTAEYSRARMGGQPGPRRTPGCRSPGTFLLPS